MLANFTDKTKMVTIFTRTIFVSRAVVHHQPILFIWYIMRWYIMQHTSSLNRSSAIELQFYLRNFTSVIAGGRSAYRMPTQGSLGLYLISC